MRHNTNLDSATKTDYQCGMLRTPQGLEKLRELLADPLGDNAVALDDEIWTLSGGMIDPATSKCSSSAMSSRISAMRCARIGSLRATSPCCPREEDHAALARRRDDRHEVRRPRRRRADHRLRCAGCHRGG